MDLTNSREIARLIAHAAKAATDDEIGEALSNLLCIEIAGHLDPEDLACRALLIDERQSRARICGVVPALPTAHPRVARPF